MVQPGGELETLIDSDKYEGNVAGFLTIGDFLLQNSYYPPAMEVCLWRTLFSGPGGGVGKVLDCSSLCSQSAGALGGQRGRASTPGPCSGSSTLVPILLAQTLSQGPNPGGPSLRRKGLEYLQVSLKL